MLPGFQSVLIGRHGRAFLWGQGVSWNLTGDAIVWSTNYTGLRSMYRYLNLSNSRTSVHHRKTSWQFNTGCSYIIFIIQLRRRYGVGLCSQFLTSPQSQKGIRGSPTDSRDKFAAVSEQQNAKIHMLLHCNWRKLQSYLSQ